MTDFSNFNNLKCNILSEQHNKLLLDCNTKVINNTINKNANLNVEIKKYSPSNIPDKLKLVPSPVYGMT